MSTEVNKVSSSLFFFKKILKISGETDQYLKMRETN